MKNKNLQNIPDLHHFYQGRILVGCGLDPLKICRMDRSAFWPPR